MRRGFTLLELVAYIGLLTTLMVMVGAAEQSIRTTLWLQQASLDTHQRSVAFESRLRDDIRTARRVDLVDATRLVLVQADEELAEWSFAAGELHRNGQLITRGLESWSFALRDGGVAFDGSVEARVGRFTRSDRVTGWSAPRIPGGE